MIMKLQRIKHLVWVALWLAITIVMVATITDLII
jgi:hypothetical protein